MICSGRGVGAALMLPRADIAAMQMHLDEISRAVALVHVAPGTAHPQHVEHAVEKTPVIVGRAASAPRSEGNSAR